MGLARVYVMMSALALVGCGSRSISGDESTTSTSSTETETESTSEPEPPECSEFTCGPTLDGPLSELVGVETDHTLDCLLGALATRWWLANGELIEIVAGQTRKTLFHADGVGGVLVLQWIDEVPVRAEHCELAPPEFFTACEQTFDETCADLDSWVSACTDENPTCPVMNDCGLDKNCPTLELGDGEGEVDYDPTCVWTALRDAELLHDRVVVYDTHQGWSYERSTFYLDAGSRDIGRQRTHVDDVTNTSSLGRCELQPAAFFQGCLDDPEGEGCRWPSAWVSDCVEAPAPCLVP